MERWPNFFIVGAPKAGTTSLYEYLSEISGIYMSPVKEPKYLAVNTPLYKHVQKPIRDKDKYLSLFNKVKDEKIIGEASASYLRDPETPGLIHQVSPHARILISLRDPVNRLFSEYLGLDRKLITLPFHDEIERTLNHKTDDGKLFLRLNSSLYSENVKKYLDIFGPNQVKIIIFEEWIQDVKNSIEEILGFLGLNYPVSDLEFMIHNPYRILRGSITRYIFHSETVSKIAKRTLPTKTRRLLSEKLLFKKQPKPQMNQEDRDSLIKFYQDDVEKLQNILGRKLPWPNFENRSYDLKTSFIL